MTTGSTSGTFQTMAKKAWDVKGMLTSIGVILGIVISTFTILGKLDEMNTKAEARAEKLIASHNESAKSHLDLRDALKVILDASEKDRNMIIDEIRKLK
jgi:hypothetical protein